MVKMMMMKGDEYVKHEQPSEATLQYSIYFITSCARMVGRRNCEINYINIEVGRFCKIYPGKINKLNFEIQRKFR